MRSIEDKQQVSGTNHNQNRASHHRTALGKPTPSKWDDAQKWLVNLSRGGGGGERNQSNEPRNSNADDRRLIAPVPKKECSSDEDEGDTKKVECDDESVWRINKSDNNSTSAVRSVHVRDMGTEMTPIASQEPSRTATPVRPTSPVNSGLPAPVRSQPEQTSSTAAQAAENRGPTPTRFRDESSNDVSKAAENGSVTSAAPKLNPLETRAMAWDEAERAKYMARYKGEEVKIQAWENHEKRKAEMEMKRMEVKAERQKCRAQEKYNNKVAALRRIAEEKRANAEAKLNEQAVRTSERADYIRRTGHLPSSFSLFNLPSSSCYCCR